MRRRIAALGTAIALILSWTTLLSAQTAVRVATWNIETVGSPGSTEYNAALAVLNRIDADIVGIQEVASTSDNANLQSLATAAGYPHVIVPTTNPFGALRNAFISKYPFLSTTIHTAASLSGDPTANDMTRLLVEAVVDVPGNAVDLTLVTEHWKASTGNDDEFRRAVESFRIAQALASLDAANDAYMIMGDVNEEIDSVPGSPTVFTSLPSGLPQTFNLGADLVAEMNGPGILNNPFHYIEQNPSPDITAIPALQLDGTDATRPASGRRLDYLMVSEALDQYSPPAEVYDSSDEGLPGGLPKSGSALSSGTSLAAADHLLVFTDLTVPPSDVCQPTLGFGGPGSAAITVCGDPLTSGGSADLLLTGGPTSSVAFLLYGTSFTPTPFKGGTLVPLPWIGLTAVPTDGLGEFQATVSGGGGPLTIYMQGVYADGGLPGGAGMTNVLQLDFLP